jgi:ligand-binding sensor domain-containing protein
MEIKRIITLIFLLLDVYSFCLSQTPFIRNYAPEEYKAETQNWAIAQDKNGFMYFCNNFGLLVFDGLHWDLFPTASTVRSICIANDNRIYVGIKGDFGYFKPVIDGKLTFISLKNKIPLQHRQFNNVWRCFSLNNKIYFSAYEKLFVYENDTIKVFSPEKESFFRACVANENLYISETNIGIKILKNDSLKLLEGSEFFINKKVYKVLPYDDKFVMIISTTDGIVLYSANELPKSDSTINNHIVKPKYFNKINTFLVNQFVYNGILLKDGNYAFGTISGGLVITNKNGDIIQLLNKKNGLQVNSVYSVYEDANRLLWISEGNGISSYQHKTPFELFSQNDGLEGMVYCMNCFNNKLYVGTDQTLYIQNQDKTFSGIEHTEGQSMRLLTIQNKFYDVNNALGILNIEKNKVYPVPGTQNLSATMIETFRNSPNKIWIGSFYGIYQAVLKDGLISSLNKIKGYKLTSLFCFRFNTQNNMAY